MKIIKSFSIIIILALVVGSIFGAIKGLSLLCFFLGIDELMNAKESYDREQKKQALAYSIVGLGVCICSILSFINII